MARHAQAFPLNGMTGDKEVTALWVGQSAALGDSIQPAGEILNELAGQAEQAILNWGGLFRGLFQ